MKYFLSLSSICWSSFHNELPEWRWKKTQMPRMPPRTTKPPSPTPRTDTLQPNIDWRRKDSKNNQPSSEGLGCTIFGFW